MKKIILIIVTLVLLTGALVYQYGRSWWAPLLIEVKGKRTLSEAIAHIDEKNYASLRSAFSKAGVEYPPKKLALIAVKDEKQLYVWAADDTSAYRLITQYPIRAASGVLGPKLQEGDRQVPEGLYRIIGFNPNSSYYLSMKLNYPNAFDLTHAKAEGRTQPGSNIFIHGKAVSIGCLAMGDDAVEQLFKLVYDTGRSNTEVLITPTKPVNQSLVSPSGSPEWVSELYQKIAHRYAAITTQ